MGKTHSPRGMTDQRKRQSFNSSATQPISRAKLVPLEARIATFDQDGTLWVEHHIYTQVIYCLDRVPAVVAKKPELKNVEPYKTVLTGDREAIAKLPWKDLEEILAATLSGMTVDEFQAEAKKWIATARHRAGIGSTRNSFISRCSKGCSTCGPTVTKRTS